MSSHPRAARRRAASRFALAVWVGLGLAGCSSFGAASSPSVAAGLAAAEPTQSIAQGQKYVMATHSFNVFIGPTRSRDASEPVRPGPLAALADERGKAGHEALAVQMNALLE